MAGYKRNECKYFFIGSGDNNNDGKGYTYEEIATKLEMSPEIYGILYKKSQDPENVKYVRQKKTYELIQKLKKDRIEELAQAKLDEENISIFEGSGDAPISDSKDFTVQTFIDSTHYVDKRGERLMLALNNEEYIETVRKYMEQDIMSKKGRIDQKDLENIDKQVNILRDKGKNIAKDAYDFHKIILQEGRNTNINATEDHAKGTSFLGLEDIIHNKVAKRVMSEIRKKNGKVSKEIGDDSEPKIIKHINLSAELTDIEGKIHGHYDYIAIKPDGSIEVYLIKGSHEPEGNWDPQKKEKYRHEMALLQLILAANGVDTSNISFYIIPVIFNYNEQFTEINDIKVDNAVCYSHSGGKRILFKELNNAKRFIDSPEQSIEINSSTFDAVDKTLTAIFPELDIKARAVQETAEEWVDKNWKYITQGKQPEEGTIVEIDDLIYTVKSKEKGRNNQEVVDIVKEHIEEISNSENGKYSARYVVSKLKDGRRYGFPAIDDEYLRHSFEKYYERDLGSVIEGKIKYDWKIIENEELTKANMILFLNRKTGQINLVIISPMNLRLKRKLNGRDNILGFHLSDMRAQDNQGHKLMDATNGNIEIMRGLSLLNEIIPTLIPTLGDIKLGEIEVFGNLGSNTHGVSYPIQQVLPTFIKARQVLNAKDKDLDIKNNFLLVKNISPEKILISKFSDILTYHPDISSEFRKLATPIFGTGYSESGTHSDTYDGMIHLSTTESVESLAVATSTEVKIERLQEIIELTSMILRDLKHIALNPDSLIANRNSRDPLTNACVNILIEANITLDRLAGHIRIAESDLSTIDKTFARPQNMENSLVRICSKLLQDALNNTSYRLDPVISEFNVACLEYYEKKGYSKALNMIIGNQSSVFLHLFQDIDDELMFKNPFDPNAVLDNDDRKFLKKVLFIINRTRFGKRNFPYKDESDPDFEKFIENKGALALFVPLEKASASTKWTNPSKYFSDFKRRAILYAQNPTLFFKEMQEGLMTEEERNVVDEDMGNMLTHSSFRASDTVKGRSRMFAEQNYNMSHFETNIQNLVIDYVFKDILAEEMNNMLIRARGILLHLKLTGIREDGEGSNRFAKTIEHIDKYITTSVLNKSIMSEDELKLIAKIAPIRKAVTMAYIAASPVAAMRDTIGGFISNTMRALWKFRTDIDLSDVMWAYGYVLGQGIHSAMDLDILDKMNAKYLISNVNREQQLEAYKTNREGITNPSNLAYATLKKPDFLNRMVLFMGKLKHDGSKNAYSVIDGQLVYNWRMDERFNLLANNDKSDMEAYNKQAALKLSLIHALNQETPGLNIPREIDADLPDGYTRQEIESIKALGDTIYGAYDKSTKAMYENMAIGSQFGVFSTWLNGIYDVYLGKRHESSYLFEKRQAEDENGNLLYLDEDGEITTDVTDKPYYKNVPLMVQGIFNTLTDLAKYGIKGNKEEFMEAWNDPMVQMNLRRLLSDILVAGLLGLLYEMVFNPAYKEHKKKDSGNNIAVNAILEIMYKGTSTCFDEFKGPIPIMEYVTNNTNPAAFKWMSKSANDMWKLFSGQRTLGQTIVGSQALVRAMQDTYLMYQRDNK